MNHEEIAALSGEVEREAPFLQDIQRELGKAVVGQGRMVERLLIGLLANGHVLLEGVPGLAKTTVVKALARTVNASFRRIQFTPDLLPADLIGTLIYNQREGTFQVRKGPIFAHFILADEINRAPAKVQSALLEAMQERQVTIGEETFPLEAPFLVLATQNPIEQEGTYPLPEAQLDRFFFQINIDYPTQEQEQQIVLQTTGAYIPDLKKVLDAKEIIELQEIVRKVPVSDNVVEYAVKLVRATRPKYENAPEIVKKYVNWGAGPRASQTLILGAKARAVLDGRYTVSVEDIKKLAFPALRHRIILNFHAEAEGIDTNKIISELIININ